MPSESVTVTSATSSAPGATQIEAWSRRSAKGVVTRERHKQERRVASLADIRAQIANGSLIVRQMTTKEHEAAVQAGQRA